MVVQLKFATLPAPFGAIAVHYWFTVLDPASGKCDRWEVWQAPDAGGESVGHLHCNLKAPDEGVGGGPAKIDAEWRGEEASRIHSVLQQTRENYPHRHRYVPWPGPNSNTFVAWVLRQSGIAFQLHWKALGQDFAWRAG
jgi:hypothetical protein